MKLNSELDCESCPPLVHIVGDQQSYTDVNKKKKDGFEYVLKSQIFGGPIIRVQSINNNANWRIQHHAILVQEMIAVGANCQPNYAGGVTLS